MKNYIYIHLCCINNWRDIFYNIITQLKDSGLYHNIDEIRIGVLSEKDVRDQADFDDKKIKLLFCEKNLELHETPTLLKLRDDADKEKFRCLYLHGKGCSKPDNLCVKDWVNYMLYFNLYKYRKIFELLATYDAVGVNLQNNHNRLHFSGNFWWSKSDYIKKLNTSINIKDHGTFANEFWICMASKNFYSLNKSGLNHYHQRYPKEQYITNAF